MHVCAGEKESPSVSGANSEKSSPGAKGIQGRDDSDSMDADKHVVRERAQSRRLQDELGAASSSSGERLGQEAGAEAAPDIRLPMPEGVAEPLSQDELASLGRQQTKESSVSER